MIFYDLFHRQELMKNNVSYNQFVKMESISKIVERATEYVFGMQET